MAAWTWRKYAVFVPLSLATTEFRKIPWKHRNSDSFCDSAQNSTFRWNLYSPVMVHNVHNNNNSTSDVDTETTLSTHEKSYDL